MSRLQQRGSVYLIVLIVITLVTILANFLFDYFQSHTGARRAHESYIIASQRAAATMDIASAWLAAQQDPPEENLSSATMIRGATATVGNLVKQLSESGVLADSLYWFSFNNDGTQDVGFVILPAGAYTTGDCSSGYEPGCATEHLYVVISRCQYSGDTVVEQKQYISKIFYR